MGLSNFMKEFLQRRPDITGASVFGCDSAFMPGFKWEQKQKYFQRNCPRVRLQIRQMDLAKELMPPCTLTLGVHPEVASGTGPWHEIIAGGLKSTPNGLCVFAHFFESEVQAMMQILQPMGVRCE